MHALHVVACMSLGPRFLPSAGPGCGALQSITSTSKAVACAVISTAGHVTTRPTAQTTTSARAMVWVGGTTMPSWLLGGGASSLSLSLLQPGSAREALASPGLASHPPRALPLPTHLPAPLRSRARAGGPPRHVTPPPLPPSPRPPPSYIRDLHPPPPRRPRLGRLLPCPSPSTPSLSILPMEGGNPTSASRY